MKTIKAMECLEIPRKFTGIVDYSDRKEWWVKGILHRLDGPAIEWIDGGKVWHIEGFRHRLDGPAFEHSNGTKGWYIEGNCHRLDGPAVEYADGRKEWYVYGSHYSQKSKFREVSVRFWRIQKENPGLTLGQIDELARRR